MVIIREEHFGNYALNVLRNSIVTGVPQIVDATSTPKKLIRALVLAACVLGFLYQSSDFMDLYWQYKTITDVSVQTTKETELPSITLCNLNGATQEICFATHRLRAAGVSHDLLRLYTSETPQEELCSVMDDSFLLRFLRCKKYDVKKAFITLKNYYDFKKRYSGIITDLTPSKLKRVLEMDCIFMSPMRGPNDENVTIIFVPDKEVYQEIKRMEYRDYKMLMQRLEEFMWVCGIVDGLESDSLCDLRYYQNVRCPSRTDAIEACWTLNTIIGRPETEPKKISSMGEYTMSVRPHLEEYPDTIKVAAVYLSIHGPRQILNPFTNGFYMGLNTIQAFRLRKVEKKLLPAPYDTNCIDYTKRWKLRGGRGPTNQKECFEECQKNISLKYRGCFANYYKIVGNEKICGDKELHVKVPENKITDCEKKHCFPACFEESYEVTREIIDKREEKLHPICFPLPMRYQFIDVVVNMNGMETTTYTYSPKFQNIEIFSYIGGYVGMWLGISLVAVFDFLETVLLIISYPFKSYKKTKERNKRIEDLKMLRRDL
ncbi:uncharacterized protein [Parasteatoda tepidariorum]|uniref:uncharacterized protein n=1 Tax=Parasteatoda tepidariorum TaxID=114398 RepID=UPI0039BC74F5